MFVNTIFMEDISSVHRAMNGIREGERLTGRAVELPRELSPACLTGHHTQPTLLLRGTIDELLDVSTEH